MYQTHRANIDDLKHRLVQVWASGGSRKKYLGAWPLIIWEATTVSEITLETFSGVLLIMGSVTLVLLPLKYEIDDSVTVTVVLLREAGCCCMLMGGTETYR